MEKQFKYFLIIILALFLILSGIFGWQKFLVFAQLGACVDPCTTNDIGKCCVTASGETGVCGYDPIDPQNLICQTNSAFQTHKECENGRCVDKPGSGPDLCRSDVACQQYVCEGQRCVLRLAPGPGGLGPNQCRSDTDCRVSTSTQPNQPAGGASGQPNQPAGGEGVFIPNPIGPGTFQDLVERIARYLFQIGIPIAVIMILYAAFLYMTAGGSEEKVSKAHKALTYAVVGLAILFLAWGITSLVKELLGGETTPAQQQQLPQQDYPDYWQRQQQQLPQQPDTNPDAWQWR